MNNLKLIFSLFLIASFGYSQLAFANKSTVVIPITWVPNYPNLNSDKAEEVNLNKIYNTVFDTLLGMDNTFHPTPKVLKSWKVDSNNRSIDFFIDPKAKFNDGAEVLSKDVLSIFLRASKKKSKMVSQIKGIYGCSIKKCRGLKILSNKSFRVYLNDHNYLIFFRNPRC